MIRPSTISGRRRRVAAVLLAGVTSAALVAGVTADGASAKPGHRGHGAAAKVLPQKTFTFTGANTGAIPDATTGTNICGNATNAGTRDVTFTVSGVTAPLTAVSVSFNLVHTFVGDVSATLIAPDGTTTASIFNRIGATGAGGGGGLANCGVGSTFNGAYTFNGVSTTSPWTAPPGSGVPYPAGTYRATAPLTGALVNPASPFQPFATAGLNGTWKLRFTDTGVGDTGTVSAVTLNLTAADTAPCTAATAKVAAAQAALGDAGNKATSATSALQKAKAKLKKAKKSGNKAKIKKAKKRVKRAIAIKKAADAAVVAAQAAVAAAQAEQTAVC